MRFALSLFMTLHVSRLCLSSLGFGFSVSVSASLSLSLSLFLSLSFSPNLSYSSGVFLVLPSFILITLSLFVF